jgi:hypothetical protein
MAPTLIGRGLSADVFDNGDGTVLKVYRPDMPPSLYLQDYTISKKVSERYGNMPAVLGLTDALPYPGIILMREILRAAIDDSIKARILAFLESQADEGRLCHNDYMPTNVVLAKGRAVVIDWRTATRGNPLADVARICILLRAPGKDISLSLYRDIVRKSFFDSYLKEYMKLAEVPEPEMTKWLLVLSAARLNERISKKEELKRLRFIEANSCII